MDEWKHRIIHAQATHPEQCQTHFSLRVGRQKSRPRDKTEFLSRPRDKTEFPIAFVGSGAVVTPHLTALKLWFPKKSAFSTAFWVGKPW